MNKYYVYILTNRKHGVLYIGVTNDLSRRHFEHETHVNSHSFSAKYNLDKLVYFEEADSPEFAIAREKQLKAWHRQWKNELIETNNPKWKDLSNVLFEHQEK